MKPHARINCRRAAQHGFSLVSAIFLLVVLAAMGAAMLTVFTVHQASSSMDVQGSRAYQAARAGVEWGLYQQIIVQARPPKSTPACFAKNTFGFPNAPTLAPFTVTVSCIPWSLSNPNGDPALYRWQLTAVVCNQPPCPNANPSNQVDYIERVLQVEI